MNVESRILWFAFNTHNGNPHTRPSVTLRGFRGLAAQMLRAASQPALSAPANGWYSIVSVSLLSEAEIEQWGTWGCSVKLGPTFRQPLCANFLITNRSLRPLPRSSSRTGLSYLPVPVFQLERICLF